MSVQLVDPSSSHVIRSIAMQDGAAVEETISEASLAFSMWRRRTIAERLECIAAFEMSLQSHREDLALQISLEMGKIQSEALAEIDKCVSSCTQLRHVYPKWKAEREYQEGEYSITYEPLGPLLAIMPWNFPVWQVVRFAIPALISGNTILLKHAPNTWGVAETLTKIFNKVFPVGIFSALWIGVDKVPALIADPRLRGVSLTGSRQAGAEVGALAGRHLKKCVLELGGCDAYVILDDADIEKAAELCVQSRMINAGQSCVAAKRFIVTENKKRAFTEALIERMKTVTWGAPMDPQSKIGPLARRDLRDGLHAQVEATKKQGAQCVLGGAVPNDPGFFYPPTVLTGVVPGQVAFDEELFGPVAAVVTARDEAQALEWANRSRYGLGGAIFSRDVERARKLAREELEVGMVFINDFVRSDVRVPFGGIKDSGLGRELGREGCFEFCNVKTIKV